MLLRAGSLLTISLFLLFLPFPVAAIYDPLSVPNNRFGIHVFDPGEVEKAAQFVNSSGGEWGYITVPIRANDRDRDKWLKFMEEAKKRKVIPILRLASYPIGPRWAAPNEWDLVDSARFLNELPWPTKNRYVIIYNEPNHQNEWGGFLYPEEYARVLDRAVDIFHKTHPDFFVISAGFDSAAPNGDSTLNIYDYISVMNDRYPGIFSKVDGISFHAYGNPAFSAFPNLNSRVNIGSYKFELDYLSRLGVANPKVFLTEVGWRNDLIGDSAAKSFYLQAFKNVWIEDNIVAITPFVLEAAAGPFKGFSFTEENGSFKPFAKALADLPKTAGRPKLSDTTFAGNLEPRFTTPSKTTPSPIIQIADIWDRIRTFFRK